MKSKKESPQTGRTKTVKNTINPGEKTSQLSILYNFCLF